MRFRRFWGKQPRTSTPPQTVSEIHWRAGDATPTQANATSNPPTQARQDEPKDPPIYHAPAKKAQTVSEIHWRQGEDKRTRA